MLFSPIGRRQGENAMDEREPPSGRPIAVQSMINRPDLKALAERRPLRFGRLHPNALRTRQLNPQGLRAECTTNRPGPETGNNWPTQIQHPVRYRS